MRTHSIILTSGTLAPLDGFASEVSVSMGREGKGLMFAHHLYVG
jgi:hypothetical protein